MLQDLREAYGDWAVVLGTAGSAFALFSFGIHVFSAPVSVVAAAFLDAYRGLFHFPFTLLEAVFALDVPVWLRDVLVFWVLLGGVGGRVFLRIGRAFLDGARARRSRMEEALGRPEVRRELERRYGGPDGLGREITFLDEEIAKNEETQSRRRLLLFGCIVTGPLFFLGLAYWNPPRLDRAHSARRLLIIDLAMLALAAGVLFVLNWSLPKQPEAEPAAAVQPAGQPQEWIGPSPQARAASRIASE